MTRYCAFAMAIMGTLIGHDASGQTNLQLTLQAQTKSANGDFEKKLSKEAWTSSETAIIVCDVWDYHHCFNAVGRLNEIAPTMNKVIAEARRRGVTIIHSPSACMEFYKEYAARKRAIEAPTADNLPKDIEAWCHKIPAEEEGKYPIDQSDGGEDDDPKEHEEWAAKLQAMGRNPKSPWQRQLDTITIDDSADFITDKGDEVWNVLESKGIKNVILVGVHTNMCVLGRPFGLRQMARNGKHVVLMRDMTDTMYNPKMWPYVSHFEGTRRIVSHIEKFVCPTITSDQIIGGKPLCLKGDEQTSQVDQTRQ